VVKSLRRLISVAVSLLALTSAVWAGPLFPDVRAAMSANGKFLVTMEFEYLNPDQQVRTITRSVIASSEEKNSSTTNSPPQILSGQMTGT
jgi:hypothetical protein